MKLLGLLCQHLSAALPHLRDDLIRAIKKLKALGTGFGIIPVSGTYLIQSVPAELNMDHTVVLQLAEVLMCVCMCVCVYVREGILEHL